MLKNLLVAFAALCLAQPVYADDIPQSDKEIECIALAIQKEAGNQSYEGMKAVGHVILNRTHDPKYPGTACKVVYQKNGRSCQFSWVCTRNTHGNISDKALLAANDSVKESDNTLGAVAFHIKQVHPNWRGLRKTVTIGSHVFYASADKSRKISPDLS